MFLRLKPFAAPTSHKFVDPDTGYNYQATTRAELVARIVAYRGQNSLPQIEMLDVVLENYWCALPDNAGKCVPRRDMKRGIMASIKGGIMMAYNMAIKNKCTQEEADRRAAICVKCPHNSFPDKGAFNDWADEMAVVMVGESRTALHNELGNCAVCECPLRGKVFYDGKLSFPRDQEDAMRAVNCWQIGLLKKD